MRWMCESPSRQPILILILNLIIIFHLSCIIIQASSISSTILILLSTVIITIITPQYDHHHLFITIIIIIINHIPQVAPYPGVSSQRGDLLPEGAQLVPHCWDVDLVDHHHYRNGWDR